MPPIYDPNDPAYLDRRSLDEELTRVFDLCQGCRMCVGYCDAFPVLFEAADRYDQDVTRLSAQERAAVVDACFQCKLCTVRCPYVPPHEWALDFARLMQRARAVQRSEERVDVRERLTDVALASMNVTGPLGSALAPLANRALRPGSPVRMVGERFAGIAARRRLPSYARRRFSSWFRARRAPAIAESTGSAALYPSCFVEYMEPGIGAATTAVLERLGVRVRLAEPRRCCGAPWLHQGQLDRFRAQASVVAAGLAAALDAGAEVIVVPQPTCAYVLRHDYPAYLGTETAARVGRAVRDPSDYVMELVRSGVALPEPSRELGAVTYHAACHLQAQGRGLRARDLLERLGARVSVVARCSGIDGTWGWRTSAQPTSVRMAQRLARDVRGRGSSVVVGDCHLANTALDEQLGISPQHPMELVAEALGVVPEPIVE